MGIGKTSDRDRERKRAAKTHGCVWRHAEFMNVVMSSLGQTFMPSSSFLHALLAEHAVSDWSGEED